MYRILCALLLCFLLFPYSAQAWRGKVHSVTDGDTIVVTRQDTGENVRIRLYGIDAPETKGRAWKTQPYGKKSAAYLATLLQAGDSAYIDVAVYEQGLDKYQRTVAGVVTLPGGLVVQEEMLRAGMAWVYQKYCKDCRQWTEIQGEARSHGLGLWQEANPVAPWEWRHAADKTGTGGGE